MEFRTILQNTGNTYLLEFDRSAKRLYEKNVVQFYSGLIDCMEEIEWEII